MSVLKRLLGLSLLGLFGSCVFANAPGHHSATAGLWQMAPIFIAVIAIMYFMTIRPQSKKQKEQKNLLNNIKPGDEVVSIGGIVGCVDAIVDGYFIVTIADNMKIKFQKQAIATILPKGSIAAAD
jgi:preprotein translocase subunit YajC